VGIAATTNSNLGHAPSFTIIAAAVEGGSLLATLFCWFGTVLLLICAVLQFTRKRALGCWLLVLIPTAVTAALLVDLSHGPRNLGEASFESDLKGLLPSLGFLAVTLLAALRPGWRWLFWIAWLVCALLCSIAIYLEYFWKVFS
jgi:hypothetical protein